MGCSTISTTYITSLAGTRPSIGTIEYSSIDEHESTELERKHHGDSPSTTTDDPDQRPTSISIERGDEYAYA